jgi:hypothetical protein
VIQKRQMTSRFAGVRSLISAAAFAGLVAGCAPSITVRTDYQPGTNFAAYKTFTMGDEKGEGNPLAIQRVRRALQAQLTAKGLSQVQSDGDLSLRAHVRLRVDTKVDVWNSSGWGYGYHGHGGTYVDVRNVPMGTLVVDLVDRAKGEAVWRGIAEGSVDQDATPQESEQRINSAVEQLFRNFPPKS